MGGQSSAADAVGDAVEMSRNKTAWFATAGGAILSAFADKIPEEGQCSCLPGEVGTTRLP